jgi:hypothetical protein
MARIFIAIPSQARSRRRCTQMSETEPGAADFRRFLREYPQARAEIDRVAAARTRANEEKEAV